MVLIEGDSLRVLLPVDSVDLVVADPPYNVLSAVRRVDPRVRRWDYFSSIGQCREFKISTRVQQTVEALGGGWVLDPFLGSGTTMAAGVG